jgi:Domain of unknown function (DUF4347)
VDFASVFAGRSLSDFASAASNFLTRPALPLAEQGHFFEQTNPSRSLLFIDSAVADYQQLIAGAAPGTEVHVLSSTQDAIAQIGDRNQHRLVNSTWYCRTNRM